jgi:hypothetical protein
VRGFAPTLLANFCVGAIDCLGHFFGLSLRAISQENPVSNQCSIAVVFRPDPGATPQRLYIWSHSLGDNMALRLRAAIHHAGLRGYEPELMARIIVEQVIGSLRGGVSGFGISPMLMGNDHWRILVISPDEGLVWVEDADDLGTPADSQLVWAISKYATMDEEAALEAMKWSPL